MSHTQPVHQLSSESIHNFLRYPAHRQTDRQGWKHNLHPPLVADVTTVLGSGFIFHQLHQLASITIDHAGRIIANINAVQDVSTRTFSLKIRNMCRVSRLPKITSEITHRRKQNTCPEAHPPRPTGETSYHDSKEKKHRALCCEDVIIFAQIRHPILISMAKPLHQM